MLDGSISGSQGRVLSILFPLTGNIKFGNPLRQMLGSTWDTLTLCPLFHPSPFSARFPMAKTIARLNFCLTSFGQKKIVAQAGFATPSFSFTALPPSGSLESTPWALAIRKWVGRLHKVWLTSAPSVPAPSEHAWCFRWIGFGHFRACETPPTMHAAM